MKKSVHNLFSEKRYLGLPLLAVTWNELVYYLGRIIAKNRVHYEFELPADHKIPLLNWTISIYLLCFLFWAFFYIFMATREKKAAYRFFLADIIGKVICFFFFVFVPTTVIRPEITGNGLWDIMMRLLYQIDSPDNLFPSIHCMVSWFCFIGIRKQKECPTWCVAGTLLIAIAICISTLTTKQHVVADVIGGIFFAEVSYFAADAIIRRLK